MTQQQWLVVSTLMGVTFAGIEATADPETATVRYLARMARLPWIKSLMAIAPAQTTASQIPRRTISSFMQRGGNA